MIAAWQDGSVLGHAIDRILDAALPARCPGCGREGEPVCPGCRPAFLARLDLPPGTPIGLPSETPAPLVQLEWCAPYEGAVRRALHELKYAGERRLARPLGQAIAARWARAGVGGECLVPVPVHADRARSRGYDQAALLAEAAGEALGMPAISLLRRTRATTAQYRLDRADRASNVADAFAVRAAVGSGAQAVVAGHWIVLLDDVVTTGATLAACAAALLAAGAMAVSAVTVAHER